MLEKGNLYEAEVTDYTAQGQGVARVEGCAVFVPGAIVGERCRIRIDRVGKTWASGLLDSVAAPSPWRIDPDCPASGVCGGCVFRHLAYEEELRMKAGRVQQALGHIGGLKTGPVPILGAAQPEGYRNKAQYPIAVENGRAAAGFYRAGSHQVIATPRCRLLMPQLDEVRRHVVDYLNEHAVSVYDERTGKGLARHLYVRRGAVSGQILVCLVINGRNIPEPESLIARLKTVEGFRTLALSVHTRPGNTVLGGETIPLYGPGWISDTLCGLTFRLSPQSFYQVNHDQAERLYDLAITQAALTPADTVLDLYCGVGTITLAMAKAAGRVIGVEAVPEAVADARENARRNGIENAEFFCADAGSAAQTLESQGIRPDVVVVDPPRKGLSRETVAAIGKLAPRRLVYVSCDPATLARDLAALTPHGYRLQTVTAVDMFPRCAHVETVCLLSKLNVEHHIEIEVKMDEMDLTAAEKKATYDEIKACVLEHSGLKVSNLYIAQVKQKCGIMEALKHFGMI